MRQLAAYLTGFFIAVVLTVGMGLDKLFAQPMTEEVYMEKAIQAAAQDANNNTWVWLVMILCGVVIAAVILGKVKITRYGKRGREDADE